MTVANGGDDVAGKTETKPESEFEHLSHSGNTQDLKAADPYVTSKMEGLHARHLHENPDGEETFGTSVMKSDYRPGKRSVAVFFLQLLSSSCLLPSAAVSLLSSSSSCCLLPVSFLQLLSSSFSCCLLPSVAVSFLSPPFSCCLLPSVAVSFLQLLSPSCLLPSVAVSFLSPSFSCCLLPSVAVSFLPLLSPSFSCCFLPSVAVSFLQLLSSSFSCCLLPSVAAFFLLLPFSSFPFACNGTVRSKVSCLLHLTTVPLFFFFLQFVYLALGSKH